MRVEEVSDVITRACMHCAVYAVYSQLLCTKAVLSCCGLIPRNFGFLEQKVPQQNFCSQEQNFASKNSENCVSI